MINLISFETIRRVWANELWPGRIDIEPVSAMCYMTGHDMTHFELPVVYVGMYKWDELVGVNSGHMCADNSFRSRGLWVSPEYRGKGFGAELLQNTLDRGQKMNASFCWSLPRKTSWSTYSKVGFYRTSNWSASETSEANAFCRLDY